MAIQEIVLAIDAYIDRLKEARDVIASLCLQSETSDKEPTKRKNELKNQSSEVPVPSPGSLEVAVQIIPARVMRQRRRLKKSASPTFSALGGPIPKNPVVVRSPDLAQIRSASSQVIPSLQSRRPHTSSGPLEELVQEVAQRLASSSGFHH